MAFTGLRTSMALKASDRHGFRRPFYVEVFSGIISFLVLDLFYFLCSEKFEFPSFSCNFEQEPSPSSRGHGFDLLQSICVFIEKSKHFFPEIRRPVQVHNNLGWSCFRFAGSVSFCVT